MKVYKVTNNITGLAYIGQTTRSIEDRWNEHCKPALKSRSYLSNAIQKYGKENFLIEELGVADTQEDLDKLEKTMIEQYKTMVPNGYNLKEGGFGGKHSEVIKEKCRRAATGRIPSKETLAKRSQTLKGIKIRINPNSPKAPKPIVGTNIKTGEKIYLDHSGAKNTLGFNRSCVHKCAQGKRKQHKGHKWKYAG